MLKYIGDLDLLVSKYGFEERPFAYVWGYGTDNAIYNIQKGSNIIFRCKSRNEESLLLLPSVLYDLIKDGLVEKVDD